MYSWMILSFLSVAIALSLNDLRPEVSDYPLAVVNNLVWGKKTGFVLKVDQESVNFTHIQNEPSLLTSGDEFVDFGDKMVEEALSEGHYTLSYGEGSTNWWVQFTPYSQSLGLDINTNWICIAGAFVQNPGAYENTIAFKDFYSLITKFSYRSNLKYTKSGLNSMMVVNVNNKLDLTKNLRVTDYPRIGVPPRVECFRIYTRENPIGWTFAFGGDSSAVKSAKCSRFHTQELRYYMVSQQSYDSSRKVNVLGKETV